MVVKKTIKIRIEELREEMHKIIIKEGELLNQMIIEKSKELDKLLNLYHRNEK